jgi:hypothetical protein
MLKRTIPTFLLAATLFASTANAHSGYHYAGLSHTAKVARYSSAIMTVKALPTQVFVQAIGWTALWDRGASENYVEAGVGKPYKYGGGAVYLWWASDKKWSTNVVGSVPLGTPVLVELSKVDGTNRVTARWTWTTASGTIKSLTKSILVSKWYTGPGIHPTQAEVYTNSTTDHPRPFIIDFQDVTLYPQDSATAYLCKDDPYYAVGTLTDFSVTYP